MLLIFYLSSFCPHQSSPNPKGESLAPSKSNSFFPTSVPSYSVTNPTIPSLQPGILRTSYHPSRRVSPHPSSIESSQIPSILDSSIPSYSSSHIPSAIPSTVGSSSQIPTHHLSDTPSELPSRSSPTNIPSTNLSPRPSVVFNDSMVPTLSASNLPSKGSSINPSIETSLKQSEHPSHTTSSEPSPFYDYTPTTQPNELGPCGMISSTRSLGIIDRLQNVTRLEILSNSSTSQGKALNWLLNEDEALLCPDAKKLIQRYILAVIYYSTGGDNWSKCSKSSTICSEERQFLNKTNFLSSENECFWAGIRCSADSMCVTQIEFGTFMLYQYFDSNKKCIYLSINTILYNFYPPL